MALGIVSLGYTGWLHYRVDSVVNRRERQLIEHWAPQMRSVYADMFGKTNVMRSEPKTLEELFEPFFQLIEKMGAADREPTNILEKGK